MNFNKVIFGGRLTRDPQLRYLPSQVAVVDFGVVCNRKFKTKAGEEKEEATFLDCVAWGKTGEVINQYFTKGKPILLEGALKYETWEAKDGGGKRHAIKLNVESFQFCGGNKSDGASGDAPAKPRPAQKEDDPFGAEAEFGPESIPF